MSKPIHEAVGVIVSELSPFSSEERMRVVQASLTLLGEGNVSAPNNVSGIKLDASAEGEKLPPKVVIWLKQNSLSEEQISSVFHDDGDGYAIIASSIPGKTNREKVRNAYVLVGVSHYLKSGEAKFEDKEARAVCQSFGFFDGTNHMKYMKGGNEFAGAKEKGWSLTAPGLKHGAGLVLGITGG